MIALSLLTDLPEWNAPLVAALERLGAEVVVLTQPGPIPTEAVLLNRVSAGIAARDRSFAGDVESFLLEAAQSGRRVINGAGCFRLGYDKWAQAVFFAQCGVRTPRSALAEPGVRQLPDCPVLMKPRVGGFGRGIVALAPGVVAPDAAFGSGIMLEQERIEPIDQAVHRAEVIGSQVLYEAVTQLEPDRYDYCLATGESATELRAAPVPEVCKTIVDLADRAGMEIGSVEYLLDGEGEPWFIDLNPVSSYHPAVEKELGFDPVHALAEWVVSGG